MTSMNGHRGTRMTTTSAQRMRAHRARRRRREVQLTIEVSEIDTCGRSRWLGMPRPRRTGRPGPSRSRYSSATSASGCAKGALQRNGYAVTQRCVATVAPQQPRNGVTLRHRNRPSRR